MGLFKRAHVRGMAHELSRQGLVSWPSKLAEEETADAIADNMDDEELPEDTGETGLSPIQAKAILDQIVDVAQAINANTQPDPEEAAIVKESAYWSYEDAALYATQRLFEKCSAEASTGPIVPGNELPVPDLSATAEGGIDATEYPASSVVGPQGVTSFVTAPGEVGSQNRRPDQPGAQGSQPDNEVAKMAQVLYNLGKQAAMDGASLSGGAAQGPTPAPRLDLPDNLNIPGAVAGSQGVSAQKVPASANIGTLVSQPAGEPGASDTVSNELTDDVNKTAMHILQSSSEGRNLLRKMAAQMLTASR